MSVASAITALSPSSYWKLDDASFPMTDSAGAISGTAWNTPTANQPGITPGDTTGKCVSFQSVDGDGIIFGDNYDQAGTTSFTLLLFLQTTEAPTNSPFLLNKNDATIGWGFRIVNGSPNVTVRAQRGGGGVSQQINYSSYPLSTYTDGTPHMYSMRYDGTNITINIDGVDVQSGASSASITANALNLVAGRFSGGGNNYGGYMDDIAFWSGTALTEANLLGIWQAGQTGGSRRRMMLLGVG